MHAGLKLTLIFIIDSFVRLCFWSIISLKKKDTDKKEKEKTDTQKYSVYNHKNREKQQTVTAGIFNLIKKDF